MTKNINELQDKKSDLEKLEEIHRRLINTGIKTKEAVERLKKEVQDENIRNR